MDSVATPAGADALPHSMMLRMLQAIDILNNLRIGCVNRNIKDIHLQLRYLQPMQYLRVYKNCYSATFLSRNRFKYFNLFIGLIQKNSLLQAIQDADIFCIRAAHLQHVRLLIQRRPDRKYRKCCAGYACPVIDKKVLSHSL